MERFSVVDAGLRVCSVVWESRVHRSAGRTARLRAMLAGCRPGREIVGELRKVIDAGNNTIVTVQEVRPTHKISSARKKRRTLFITIAGAAALPTRRKRSPVRKPKGTTGTPGQEGNRIGSPAILLPHLQVFRFRAKPPVNPMVEHAGFGVSTTAQPAFSRIAVVFGP